MQWILAFHIISMVAWFAGLFYLPRLFVYHAQCSDTLSNERFKIMERRLFYGIMTPAGILTLIFGIWVLSYNSDYYMHAGWMHLKLTLVLLLVLYHACCWKYLFDFKNNTNQRSATFYRFFNEIPTVLLIMTVLLVTVKPRLF